MWVTLIINKGGYMDYVKYYELVVDETNRMRVNELLTLKDEAICKGDRDKVAEIDSELNNITNGGIYAS
jgi:hypothetical protein